MNEVRAASDKFYEGREVAIMDRDYCCNAVVTSHPATDHQIVVNGEGALCVNVEIAEGRQRGEIRPFELLLVETLTEDDEYVYEGVEGAKLPSESTAMSEAVARRIVEEYSGDHSDADWRAALSLCGLDEEKVKRRMEANDWTDRERKHIIAVGRSLLASRIDPENAERYFKALHVLAHHKGAAEKTGQPER